MASVLKTLQVDEKQKDEFLHELYTLKQEVGRLKEENLNLKKENVALIKAANPNQHNKEFWDDIYDKIQLDPDYVRSLIKKKVISMKEVDDKGRTILLIASYWGQYDIVQFCLNLGADIKHRDFKDKTAMDFAIGGSYYHIEQLLLFNSMHANVGNKVQQTADVINEQNSVIENIMNQLSKYDDTTNAFFKDTMSDIMQNIIKQKLAFSDVLLNLCWEFETDALKSKLWNQLLEVCTDIIANGDKMDWFWFKNFVLPSAIWFKEIDSKHFGDEKDEKEMIEEKAESQKKGTKYLYFVLLKLVNKQSSAQLKTLEENLHKLAAKNQAHWDALVTWDIDDQYSNVRQDTVPNGITAEYSDSRLFEYSSASFNTQKFYDYNGYLPQLVLLAQLVDDEFQKSVQSIYTIDRYTRSAHVQIDEKDDSDTPNIEYSRGPVKLMTRAVAKAENDYFAEPFPTSACILDLNRCSLIFKDISSLLAAIQLFINKVKFYQSGCIIGIVRDKNGFCEYVKETQYADIKLNVLIKGPQRNIIGEVQFLLQTMKMFKNKAHNLYSVQREQEYIENSVSVILPRLMDLDKQSAVAGNMGDAKTLLKLMVTNNKTDEDLLRIDNRGESVLNNLCSSGNEKAFYLLKSIVNRDLLMDRLFLNSKSGSPIGSIFKGNHIMLWRMAASMKEVQQRCKIDLNLHILLCAMYKHSNPKLIDEVLMVLNVSTDKLAQLLLFIPPSDALQDRILINVVANNKNMDVCKSFAQRIGDKQFVNSVWINNGYDTNAIEIAAYADKTERIKYLLSFEEIKNRYLNEDDLNLLFRLMFWTWAKSKKEATIDVVMQELNMSNELLIKVFKHKYDEKIQSHILRNNWKYCDYVIVIKIIQAKKLNIIKKLEAIVGRKGFVEMLFTKDMFDRNSIESAIASKDEEMVRYLISMDEVKQMYSSDVALLWRLMFWLFASSAKREIPVAIIDFVMEELQVTKEKMNKIIPFKYEKTSEKFVKNCWKYFEYSLMHRVVQFRTFAVFQQFLSYADIESLPELVVYNVNYLDCNVIELICRHYPKLDFVQYFLSNEKVKNAYSLPENEHFVWRLLFSLFTGKNENAIKEYILDTLEISQKQLSKFMSYRYPKPLLPTGTTRTTYTDFGICNEVVLKCRLPSVQFLESRLGRQAFIDSMFINNPNNLNGIEYGIRFHKVNIVKYLFSFDEIKNKIANNIDILWRIVLKLFLASSPSNELIDFVLGKDALNVSKATMNKVIAHRYSVEQKDEPETFEESAWDYNENTILNRVIWYNTVEKLEKLVSLIDENVFFENMFFMEYGTNYNPMEYCVRHNKTKIMKYLLSFAEIKQRCLTDTPALIEIIEELQRSFDQSMCDCLAQELELEQMMSKKEDLETVLARLRKPKGEMWIESAQTKKWRPCSVSAVLEKGAKWKIHYKGFHKKWDEILDRNSERLTFKKPETETAKEESETEKAKKKKETVVVKEEQEQEQKVDENETAENNTETTPPQKD